MRKRKEIRAVRYRVLPGTPAKARGMNRIAGACRHVWNVSLDRQRNAYLGWRFSGCGPRPPYPSFFTLGKAFTQLRRSPGHQWLSEISFTIVRHALKHQADAWARFFERQAGMPKFKGRGCGMGFTIPDAVRIDSGSIHIPRLGRVRLRRRGGNPHPDGVPKQAVFTPEGGKWFCTVFYEIPARQRAARGEVVGVDRNAGQCALSTGEIVHLPDLSRLEARKRRYQRRMARQQKDSGRRGRTKAKLARTCRRIRGIRSNWAHQTSRRIANSAPVVAVEKLNVRGMTETAKGTKEAPGRHVKAKAGLNKAILASGWGVLERSLEYKAGRLLRVDPAFTSQACAGCGHASAANRPNQSTFRCQACGRTANADVNAAENIRRRGLAQLDAEGRRALKARPMRRQMDGEVQRAA